MYQKDIALQDVLENSKIMTKYYKNVDKWGYDNIPAKVIWYNKLHNANLNCLDDRLEIFRVIEIYFDNKLRRKNRPVYKNEDVDLFNFLADVFPRYALLPNLHYDFIDYFLSFIPKGLSKTKTKKDSQKKKQKNYLNMKNILQDGCKDVMANTWQNTFNFFISRWLSIKRCNTLFF